MSTMSTIITPPAIACFTQKLFVPGHIGKAQPGKEEEYSIVLLFPEPALETPQWKDVKDAINAVAMEKWGADKLKDAAFVSKLKSRMPVKDAGEKQGQWAGFEPGRKFMTLKRKKSWDAPQVIDASGHQIIDPSLVFAGAVVRAGVRFFAYDNEFGRGVSATLDMVQLLKGGGGVKRLDNRVNAKDAFSKVNVPTDIMEVTLRDMGIDPGSVSSVPQDNDDSGDDDGLV